MEALRICHTAPTILRRLQCLCTYALCAGRGLIETTLEPGTLINTPKDVVPGEDGLLESCCVTPGGKKTMDSVIPETVKVMGGSILTLPQVFVACIVTFALIATSKAPSAIMVSGSNSMCANRVQLSVHCRNSFEFTEVIMSCAYQ